MRCATQFFLMCVFLFAGPAFAQPLPAGMDGPGEIAVDADAWSWAAADTVRVTVQIDESASSATAAAEKIEARRKGVVEAWTKLGLSELRIENRGKIISGAGAAGSAVTNAALVKIEMLVGVQSKSVEKAAAIVDAALKSGASSVVDVAYSVEDSGAALEKAIAEACARAKKKAQQIAGAMGVSLGRLIAVTETEETAEKVLRLKRQRGEDTDDLSDRDLHVYVSARYELVELK